MFLISYIKKVIIIINTNKLKNHKTLSIVNNILVIGYKKIYFTIFISLGNLTKFIITLLIYGERVG